MAPRGGWGRRRRSSDDAHPRPRPGPTLGEHLHAVEWTGTRPTLQFVQLVQKAVRKAPGAAAVLVAGPQVACWESMFDRAWPEIRLIVVRESDDQSEAHVRLTAEGPFDVVVQAADTSGLVQARLFQRVFMHLREGGTYLTPRMVPLSPEDLDTAARLDADVPLQREDGPREAPYVGDLWHLVSSAQTARLRDFGDHLARGLEFRDVQGLGRHLLETHVFSKMLVITTEKKSSPKLAEHEINPVLTARPEMGQAVLSIPPATVETRHAVVHNLEADPYFTGVIEAPEISLRAYRNPVCSRGQAVTSNGVLLPDTFRFPRSPRMTNIYVEESAPLFGSVRRDTSDPVPLPGVWFHLDSEWPGQFGHMMTERLSRMWAWERVKAEHPDAKVLITPHDRAPFELHQFELDLFEAAGISARDVHQFEEPCRPELLYSATPMLSLSDYLHPAIRDTWRRIGDALVSKAGDPPRPSRLFLTRSTELKRACHNVRDVERLFEAHGFTVVHPEQYPLADQVAMLRAAEAVGGLAGSGLFTTALCPEPIRVFTVGPTSYTARNEQLIAAVLGHSVVAAWSRPDIEHPAGGWSQEAFFSGFTFDLDAEGRFLDEQLALLDDPR